ncbi:MAG: hypothetical protein LC713_00840 [Actinobacteria bacterium]|nr:hypothetical protein [Actinomycetota bacterium]
MSRLRAGEWTAAIGAAALLVTLFLDWIGPADESGWSSLGWVTLAFCIAAIGCGAWLAIANAINRPVAQTVAAAVLTSAVGTLAFIALALRALLFQPGSNDVVVLRHGAYLGLLAALILALGGWLAIKDERTDAPGSAYTPPEPRPPPPARAA